MKRWEQFMNSLRRVLFGRNSKVQVPDDYFGLKGQDVLEWGVFSIGYDPDVRLITCEASPLSRGNVGIYITKEKICIIPLRHGSRMDAVYITGGISLSAVVLPKQALCADDCLAVFHRYQEIDPLDDGELWVTSNRDFVFCKQVKHRNIRGVLTALLALLEAVCREEPPEPTV